MKRPTVFGMTLVLFQSAWLCNAVVADSVTFTGSSIALKNIRIQSLQGGKLNYTDSSGQRQSRPLDDVRALGFDDFNELDEAEKALADNDLDAGLMGLLRAMLAADSDVEKLWVQARLARVHDIRKEYVQAAGHAAVVMQMSADTYWRALEPVCTPKQAKFPAVKEAYDDLQSAKAKVKVAELSNSIARMLKIVQPLHAALAAEYKGAPIAPDSTVSGFTHGEILGDGLETPNSTTTPNPPISKSTPPANAAPPQRQQAKSAAPIEQPSTPAVANDSRGAESLDALLSTKRFDEALELCRQIEKDPGQRDLGRFLYQYGLALQGGGRSQEAAVMYLRSAVLYSDGSDAPESLIKCADIQNRELTDVPTARRLLERAVELAVSLDLTDAATRARQALQSLPSTANSKEP